VILPDLNPKLKLVAVTKGRSISEIRALLDQSGLTRIAENRLEEAQKKLPQLPTNLEKHFIGKLQSRKIKAIVELFDVIQSVESLEQARLISACGKAMRIFLEVKLVDLPGRSGAAPSEVPALIAAISNLPHLTLEGVMGIASPSASPEQTRAEFRLLKSLQGALPECSMGMSDDYPIAIEEGSTLLRLGRALFENTKTLPHARKSE